MSLPHPLKHLTLTVLPAGIALLLSSCSSTGDYGAGNALLISVRDQKALLVRSGEPVKSYAISTSKFGLGDRPGSKRTPLGRMEVAKKIGQGAPPGAVFKSRRRTGEVLRPNSPGRDPIVTRIMWLRGKEGQNRNAFRRYIYIHGTPEEYKIGRPASYGCIRMRSQDIIDLYRRIGVGAEVQVIRGSLFSTHEGQRYYAKRGIRPQVPEAPRPVDPQPVPSRPVSPEPAYFQPAYSQRGYSEPAFQQRGYAQKVYHQPGYTRGAGSMAVGRGA